MMSATSTAGPAGSTIHRTAALSAALVALLDCGRLRQRLLEQQLVVDLDTRETGQRPRRHLVLLFFYLFVLVRGQDHGQRRSAELEANREGELKYNKTSLTAKAGNVSIEITNMASLSHNVTVESSSGKWSAPCRRSRAGPGRCS